MNRFDDEDSGFDFEVDTGTFKNDSSISFLHDLIAIAPSREVRELLNGLVEDIEEELLSDFTFAKQPVLGSTDYVFHYNSNNLTVNQCKSFWKKVRKCFNRILEVLKFTEEASNNVKNIKENIDGIRASNQYHDPRNINPNMRMN